ncbi:MAG: metallophosphoesterase [bacterium]
MNRLNGMWTLFLLAVFVLRCSDTKPFLRVPLADDVVQPGDPELRPEHSQVLTFYVLGDWGTGSGQQKAVADALKRSVAHIPPGRTHRPFVLGLGDNVYEHGLPEGWDNPETTRLLHETFGEMYSEVKYHGSRLTFHVVPGNHDYAGRSGGKDGFGDVLHQETTAEALFRSWKYYPIDAQKNSDTNDAADYQRLKSENIFALALPEKVSTQSGDLISIVALDTQVLLDLYNKKDDALVQKHWHNADNLLAESASWKFAIGHHPLRSHGKHGGFRKAIWWVPPVILFTLVDKLFYKRIQDLDHPANRRFQKDLLQTMQKNDVMFYLAGHEHSLQFLEVDRRHLQIVSGSAAKLSGVTHDDDTFFSHSARGFVRFDVVKDEVWIEFFEVAVENAALKSTGLFKVSK